MIFLYVKINIVGAMNVCRDKNLILQLEKQDYRVFFLNSYTGPAKKIICEVSKPARHDLSSMTLLILKRHVQLPYTINFKTAEIYVVQYS